MPELPEVEVVRLGLAARLIGREVSGVALRTPALRYPLPRSLAAKLRGQRLFGLRRRGKYLLFDFGGGHLLVHLGMSGSLRLVPKSEPVQTHDHVDIAFGDEILRLRDPRRFGALVWIGGEPAEHPLLARLGAEPLDRAFTAAVLEAALRGRRAAIKPVLMDAGVVVGIGNIYASESLHAADIDPRIPAGRVPRARLARLVSAIKTTLRAAIRAGGSSLRNYVGADGEAGSFQSAHRVYGRAGQACLRCGSPIRMLRQANRATYYCPHCQH